MAHSTLHFAIGLAIGIGCSLPHIAAGLSEKSKLAPILKKWIGISYGLAIFAIVPNLLRRMGMPEYICSGWWMNVFLAHHIIDQLITGGMILGRIALAIAFIAQYVLILLVIMKQKIRP